MPFDPITTDEKLEQPAPKKISFDNLMLLGCMSFVIVSVIVYALSIWPFFAIDGTNRLKGLALASSLGLLPAAIAGAIGSRWGGLPGACGHIAGSMAIGVFLYLRLDQFDAVRGVPDFPQPEFPHSWVYLAPTILVLLNSAIAIFFVPKNQFQDEPPG